MPYRSSTKLDYPCIHGRNILNIFLCQSFVPHGNIVNPHVLMHNVYYPQKYITLDEKYTNLQRKEILSGELSEIISVLRSVSFIRLY